MKVIAVTTDERVEIVDLANPQELNACVEVYTGGPFSLYHANRSRFDEILSETDDIIVYSADTKTVDDVKVNAAASSILCPKRIGEYVWGAGVICKISKTKNGYEPISLRDEEIDFIVSAMGIVR